VIFFINTLPFSSEKLIRYIPDLNLSMGMEIPGPAIILEQDATAYIPSNWTATVTEGSYLRIRKND